MVRTQYFTLQFTSPAEKYFRITVLAGIVISAPLVVKAAAKMAALFSKCLQGKLPGPFNGLDGCVKILLPHQITVAFDQAINLRCC